MPEKHIAIAAEIFPPSGGGPATYLKLVVPAMLKQGYRFKAVTFGDKQQLVDIGIPVSCISLRLPIPIRMVRYVISLYKQARDAAVMLVMGSAIAGMAAVLIKKITGVPLILRVPGDYVWERMRHRGYIAEDLDGFYATTYNWRIELYKQLQKFVVRTVDTVYVTSDFLEHIAIDCWGVPADRVVKIYSSFKPPQQLSITKDEARQSLGLAGKNILCMARLADWKGLDKVISYTSSWFEKNPDWSLYIAGDGPLRKVLQDQIQDLGMNDRIHLLGNIPKERLLMFYKAADGFVLNSEYEGLSHGLLEAAYFELPIIASDTAGNTELIDKYSRGVLVEWGNKAAFVTALYQLEQLAQHDVDASFFDTYSYDGMMNRILELFSNYEY